MYSQLSSPIVNVWLHNGGRLEKVRLVSYSACEVDFPRLMLVRYDNQFYVQPVEDHQSVSTNKAGLSKAGLMSAQDVENVSSRYKNIFEVDEV